MIQYAAIAEKWIETIPHIKNLFQSQTVLESLLYLDTSSVIWLYEYYIIIAHTKNLNLRIILIGSMLFKHLYVHVLVSKLTLRSL